MYSILDIDLDYFKEMAHPTLCLRELLDWAGCSVSIVVERHNHVLSQWNKRCQRLDIAPSHILHVDEHHDMMDERQQTNIANFMFHAMSIWPHCRVHWLVQHPIDSPAMWLEDKTWDSFIHRFSHGPNRPAEWPKPDLVSVCTSPDFVAPNLAAELMEVLSGFIIEHHRKRVANKAIQATK